jgi:hypothetical protein
LAERAVGAGPRAGHPVRRAQADRQVCGAGRFFCRGRLDGGEDRLSERHPREARHCVGSGPVLRGRRST